MEIPIQNINPEKRLFSDIQQLIDDARKRVAAAASAGIATLYWHIGERINREVLGNQRAEYGKLSVSTLSTQLQHEYGGHEYSERNLRRMMQLATLFPDVQIV